MQHKLIMENWRKYLREDFSTWALRMANDISQVFSDDPSEDETPQLNRRVLRASLAYVDDKYLDTSKHRKGFPKLRVKTGQPYEGYVTWATYSRKYNTITFYQGAWEDFFKRMNKITQEILIDNLEEASGKLSEQELSDMKNKMTIIFSDFAAMFISITLAHELEHAEQYNRFETDKHAMIAGYGGGYNSDAEAEANRAEAEQGGRLREIFPQRIASAQRVLNRYLVKIFQDKSEIKKILETFKIKMNEELDSQIAQAQNAFKVHSKGRTYAKKMAVKPE